MHYVHAVSILICILYLFVPTPFIGMTGTCNLLQKFSGRLKLKVMCMKLLVEVQSTMTTNYIDAAVYLWYIDVISSCHG